MMRMEDLRHLSPNTLLLVCCVSPAILFSWIIYRALSGPLAHVPGPLISRLTNWRLKLAVIRGNRVPYIHSLHQRYGSIVRITPREISVADRASIKAIYKVGGPYLKTEWYKYIIGKPPQQRESSVFGEIDFHRHGRLRKLISASFSEKSVTRTEPNVSRIVKLAVSRMADEMQSKGHFNAYVWFMFMATDLIGEACFGESFRTLEAAQTAYMRDLEKAGTAGVIRAEFPMLMAYARRLPVSWIKDLSAVAGRITNYAEESLQRYWKQLEQDPQNIKPTLLAKGYAAVADGEISNTQLRMDARTMIIAGTDTTSLTATYAVWRLANNPEIEAALIKEVSSLPPDFVDEDLRALKLLTNVINETLRLHPPVPQGLPRYVPPGGATFKDYYIPGGTVVGVQAWSTGRDAEVWENPDEFDPSRWDNLTKEMQQMHLPFGGGSRICIGMHFAYLELRHALANFYLTFDTGVKMAPVDGFCADEMECATYFLSYPKGKRCLMERRR